VKLKDAIATLLRDGFILVFNEDRLDVVRTAEALQEVGVGNMEVTCRIRRPLEKIARLRKEVPRMLIGAASLIDFPGMLETYDRHHADDPLPSVERVAEAGAGFLVSAVNFSDETYADFAGKLPIIPGCGTATEIVEQFSCGANLCKIFPAKELGGPAFVKAVDPAIHKMISLVPTGGTSAANIGDYVAAGVLVVGASFSMIDKAVMARAIDEQNYALLAAEFKKIKALIDEHRAAKYPTLDWRKATAEQVSAATGRNFNAT